MRAERMIDSAPDYLQYSDGYREIQEAIAADLDLVAENNEDIAAQRRIMTATWGLRYWEEKVGLPVNLKDSYDIRRSRVLAKWRGVGQFRASLIERVAEAFSGGDVDVTVDIPNYLVIVTFVGKLGIPPNLDDLKAQIANIIHAHLGVEYRFTYNTYDVVKAAFATYDDLLATGLTYNDLPTATL